jgi:hypothetical protein
MRNGSGHYKSKAFTKIWREWRTEQLKLARSKGNPYWKENSTRHEARFALPTSAGTMNKLAVRLGWAGNNGVYDNSHMSIEDGSVYCT